MINICFREWLFKEAEKIPLPQVDKTCQTTCASATVVWLVKLLKNWDRILSPVEVEKISPFIIDKNNPTVEGLQVNLDNFKFNSGRLGKVVDIIPQEDEVRGAQSTGAKPISGSITVRPRKLDIGVSHGNYVDKNMAVRIPYQAIENIKSIGGCALTCLHMSGGQVHAKTVGGYKKTLLYKTNQDLFYNNTLEQYFRAAISALYDNSCPFTGFPVNKACVAARCFSAVFPDPRYSNSPTCSKCPVVSACGFSFFASSRYWSRSKPCSWK